MSKKKKPKTARVAPVQKVSKVAPVSQAPKEHAADEPIKGEYIPLVMEERDRLTAIFTDPAFVKAWRNAKLIGPSMFRGNFNDANGAHFACNRLHELRGFEAFRIALLGQAEEPKQKVAKPAESFGPAGTIDQAPEFQPAKTT